MTGFYFRAPTLFEPSAVPSQELSGILQGSRGMAEILAKSLKFANWLKTEMIRYGLDTGGPFVSESGWLLQAASNGGFAVCDVSGGGRGEDSLFYMLVSRFKGATEEVGEVVEAILRESVEITDLEIEPG